MPYTARRNLDANRVGEEFKRVQDNHKSLVVAAIATADGSDPATTQTLANATKAKLNEVIAALKTAGLMKTS